MARSSETERLDCRGRDSFECVPFVVEIADLASKVCGEGGGIKAVDRADAALSFQQATVHKNSA